MRVRFPSPALLYSREQTAQRAGVDPLFIDRLVEVGFLTPEEPGRFSDGDVRRTMLAVSLEGAAISLEAVGDAIRRGELTLSFFDEAAYERLAALAEETFQEASERTGIPFDLLVVVREAIGMASPSPEDRLREDELQILPFIELQLAEGFRPTAIERLLRVAGDSLYRVTEQEAAWWHSEVIEPAITSGKGVEEMSDAGLSDRLTPLADRSLLAMYHAHQSRGWTGNIVDAFEVMMERAGIHSRLERLPAICFLDISGYTRLTQERGDDAAAELAATVNRLVRRNSVEHGGKPIKWLGDGVMFHFPDPSPGVRAALEMVGGLADAGLPPCHVGLAAGPVLYQEGDYFGQTVNLSARIADYARANEVLVTQQVAEASRDGAVTFDELGPVELKGDAGTVHLLRADLVG
ncbi:MAG TPA: adenylate/guanylate cyclase domain-containing protein [Actinomycetota bacterium]